MRTENFKRGVVSILLVSGLAFSTISVVQFASSGKLISTPTDVSVVQGQTFVLSQRLVWDEVEDGDYIVTIYWEAIDNKPSENFTFVEVSAYFDLDNDNLPDPELDPIEASFTFKETVSPYTGNLLYTLGVRTTVSDERDGEFNVDITLRASGAGGVPHAAGDHLIEYSMIAVTEARMRSFYPSPVTVHVLGRGVSVSISPSENSGLPAQTLNYTVTVKNTGNFDDNYDLTVSDNAGWGPTLSENLLGVPAGENIQTTISVTVPVNALGCTNDNVTVIATSQVDNTVKDNDACIAHAEIVRSVNVLISPSYQENLPGENLIYDITVRNTGNIADTYSLENSDDAGWSLNLENTSLAIPPFESRTTKLTVTIPENALPCTNDNIRVIATSQENENVRAENSCIAHAQVVRGVDVSIWPSYKSGTPGATIDYTVTVKNTGNARDSFGLERGDDLGWTLVLSQTLLENVQPGENKTVTLNVTIANNAAGCTIDNIWVAATSMGNENVKDNENCQAHAAIVRGVAVSISPSEDSGVSGITLTYSVTVKNTGNVEDTFDLDASDNAGWSLTVSPPIMTLTAGQSDNATLSVTIPENTEPCTRDNITITATSQADNTVSDNASCIAHVTLPRGVEVSISPGYQEGLPGATLDYMVTVKNTGALDDNYDLTASDNAGWSLAISPTSLTVPTGENGYVTLSVTIPEVALGCTRDNIIVTATSQADNRVIAENSCIAHAVGLRAEIRAVIHPTADVYAFGEYGTGYSRSQLKFDISGIPLQGRIISAKLWLHRLAADGWDGSILLNRVDDQLWSENITASEFDAQTLTNEETQAGKFMSRGWDYLEVVNQLKVDYDIGYTYTSLRLRWANDNGSEPSIGIDDGRFLVINSELDELSIIFSSSEYNGNDPYLEVVYVPPYVVSVSISPSHQSGSPREELNYTVIVANMGNLDDNYVLTVSDNVGWDPRISPTSLAVTSGSIGEAMLSVIVPENVAPCTNDNIVVTATSTKNPTVNAFVSCLAHRVKAEFSLATLYKVSLDVNLYLESGLKLVVKFYTYTGAYQGENVVWIGPTPEQVILLENIPHPQGKTVERAELVLTDAEGATISTLSTLVVGRGTLMDRIFYISMEYPSATPEGRQALMDEIFDISMIYPSAPP